MSNRKEEISKVIGTRKDRKLRRFSKKFKNIFNFFYISNRKGILAFSETDINTSLNLDAPCARECFRKYDNGDYNNQILIESRHPNLLKVIILTKKSWGLWQEQWTDGIVDFCFTKEEILKLFSENNIEIPESFLKDFNNTLERKKEIRNLKYYNKLKQKL